MIQRIEKTLDNKELDWKTIEYVLTNKEIEILIGKKIAEIILKK